MTIQYFKETHQKDSLIHLINLLKAEPDTLFFDDFIMNANNYLYLLNGRIDKYIDGVEMAISLHYASPRYFQVVPLPDSIWQHPHWQALMKRMGFYVRPLKKKENLD